MTRSRPDVWLLSLSLLQGGAVLVFLNFAGALPLIQSEWGLTNVEAGAIQAAGQVGYIISVLLLSSLADFVNERWLIAGGTIWTGLSNLAMALFAVNTGSAILLRGLMGLGVAGIYMPGMRLISERYPSERRGRAVGIFVASFTMGAAVSVALGGSLSARLGWRLAFALMSLGPLLGGLLGWRVLFERAPEPGLPSSASEALEPQPISTLFHNRSALMAIAIYTAHTWEALGLRGWLAAYLAAVLVYKGASLTEATSSGANVAGIAIFMGAILTIITGAISDRLGRTRTILLVMVVGLVAILGLGFTMNLPWLLVVIISIAASSITNADSAVISTTLTESVPTYYLGRVLAIYSFSGFTAGSVAPIVVGIVLDASKFDAASSQNLLLSPWVLAFATLAAGSLVGLILASLLHREKIASVQAVT